MIGVGPKGVAGGGDATVLLLFEKVRIGSWSLEKGCVRNGMVIEGTGTSFTESPFEGKYPLVPVDKYLLSLPI